MKNPRKTLQNLSLILALASSTSCSSLQISNCLEAPLSPIESQIKQVLEDPEIKRLYKHYFPNGKLEFSYERKTLKTETRTFLRPDLNLRNELEYNLMFGIETKY